MSPPYYRGVPFFRLVSVILRITAQPVLLQYLKTVVPLWTAREIIVSPVRAGTRGGDTVRQRAGSARY